MRAFVVSEPGAAPRLEEFIEPELTAGASVIQVMAAGLGPTDSHAREGIFRTGDWPLRGWAGKGRLADSWRAQAGSPHGKIIVNLYK
jgi:NADPH:quinone reductase-like Zn-dependent oxidoreductase